MGEGGIEEGGSEGMREGGRGGREGREGRGGEGGEGGREGGREEGWSEGVWECGREGGEGREGWREGREGWEGRGAEGRGGHAIEHMQRPSAADLRPVSQFMYQTRHVLRNNALGVYAAQLWYVLRST